MKFKLHCMAVALFLAGPIQANAAYEIQTTNGFEQADHIYTGDTIREVGSISSFQTSGEVIVNVEKAHLTELRDSLEQLDVQLVLSIEQDADTEMVVLNAGDNDLVDLLDTLPTLPGITQVSLGAVQSDSAQ
ncbi:hypothetical protein [Vibrio ezurae]|uniref:Uncharacterized protein n=1 Tax=Vibrio ezurae NBRC 102218 TaxID=1219080 RepID=U3CQP8_9VIBR|nr:hypothetical protein [Vibrio ezurae]GAD80413.1 hypothetical protein VEZ01S_36_00020 [Vibrio ezurae NBRC 102218]